LGVTTPPRFGEVNEWDEWYEETEIYGGELNLRGGTIFGATARYDIGLSGCGKKNAT